MQKVLIRQADAVLEFCLVGPAQRSGLTDIQQLAGRAIGAGSIPIDAAGIADNAGHQFRQGLDRNLFARAGVDRFVAAIVIHQEHAEVRQVIHIQELAKRTSVTPADDALST